MNIYQKNVNTLDPSIFYSKFNYAYFDECLIKEFYNRFKEKHVDCKNEDLGIEIRNLEKKISPLLPCIMTRENIS